MKTIKPIFLFLIIFSFISSVTLKHFKPVKFVNKTNSDTLIFPGEKHFKNMKMLTHDGMNAEAYFSFDGKRIIFQGIRDSYPCDQIYMMNIDGSDLHRISNGKGRTASRIRDHQENKST